MDATKLRSYDSETYRFGPGRMAPRIVCASTARFVDGVPVVELLDRAGEVAHGDERLGARLEFEIHRHECVLLRLGDTNLRR